MQTLDFAPAEMMMHTQLPAAAEEGATTHNTKEENNLERLIKHERAAGHTRKQHSLLCVVCEPLEFRICSRVIHATFFFWERERN